MTLPLSLPAVKEIVVCPSPVVAVREVGAFGTLEEGGGGELAASDIIAEPNSIFTPSYVII
jgi:translation initiation factor 2 alpha subunit (eIF-2alpha)